LFETTTLASMVKVDPADLVDRSEVAAMLGLSSPNAVSVYARRYADFPTPIIQRGRCVLWLRREVAGWKSRRT